MLRRSGQDHHQHMVCLTWQTVSNNEPFVSNSKLSILETSGGFSVPSRSTLVRHLCSLASACGRPTQQSKSIEILEKAQKEELTSGRGPTGIAAAALYVSALLHGEKRTQREVADVAGVTEVTIRNRYKELFKKLKLKENPHDAKKKKKAKKG